jgi:hypothetical protein
MNVKVFHLLVLSFISNMIKTQIVLISIFIQVTYSQSFITYPLNQGDF